MAGGTQLNDDGMITDINVTPLVDIMLVLLIIFMLTANVIARASIEVDLPEAATGKGVEPTTVALTLTESGELYLNGERIEHERLRETLEGLAAADEKTQAIIAADRKVEHGSVVRLIDDVRLAGIYRFALNVDMAPVEESKLQ